MSKYRAVVHKVLDDGTEVEYMRCEDDEPWEVGRTLEDWAKRLKREPRPVQNFPGQLRLEVA